MSIHDTGLTGNFINTSTEWSLSEAYSRSEFQEMPFPFWKLGVQYYIHNSPLLNTNISHLNPVKVAIPYFSKIHFNVNLSFTSPKLSFPSGLLFKVGIKLQLLSYMPRTHLPHPTKLFKLITFYCFCIRISGIDVKRATAVRILSFDILIHISWLGVSCQWDHTGTHVDALINDIHFN